MNVLFHFITTPIGVLGVFGLIRKATKSASTLVFLSFLYLLSLLPVVPNGVFFGTAILCASIVQLTRVLELNVVLSIALIVIGYFAQDLAHYFTGEATFQDSYTEDGAHVRVILMKYEMNDFEVVR
jgi:hypothetical protein